MRQVGFRWLCVGVGLLTVGVLVAPGRDPTTGPLSPQEERATFRVPKGFQIELVACEPAVVDPVALAFDEDGRLFVAEMPGYPNGGIATGAVHSGMIKRLEDRDGDGFYEHSTVFASGLRFPTSVMPWNGGILATVAPDIMFFKDTDGDGRADHQRRLYTGFGLENIQQLVNALQWGLDNWVYACSGSNASTVRSLERPDQAPVILRGRGVRFHPDRPGDLEPVSSGGQFGLAADDSEHWFTATNSQHLRHIVLPDHCLRRNPALPVSAVTLDIPDHGAACQVFRRSPFEGWRVERTRRRRQGPDAQRFPSTELVPGGYITSACSPVVYTADLFPAAYRGSTFVCDPANNLLHQDFLAPKGATFTATRAEPAQEFLASTDNWFRPVNLSIGPDGALYVVDFYREVIETPLSLPDDIKKQLNLQSRGRGRIWRILPEGSHSRRRPALSKASSGDLVALLADPNPWWRLTAQRLLLERQDRTVAASLDKLARQAPTWQGRVHALWTLHGLGALPDALMVDALKDREPGAREQALRLAEGRLANSAIVRQTVVALAADPSPQVRFQLAFSLGEADHPELLAALAQVARRDVHDPWTQIAVLSSCYRTAAALLQSLAQDKAFTAQADAAHVLFWTRLAALVGARPDEKELGRAFDLLATDGKPLAPWQGAVLQGLGEGLQNSGHPLSALWRNPPPALTRLEPLFQQAAATARDDRQPVENRITAVRLMAFGPGSAAVTALPTLLAPQTPTAVQLAAIRALSVQESPRVAELLLRPWPTYSPAVRREVLEAVFARADRIPELLRAIEQKQILAGQLEPFRVQQLRQNADNHIRQRASALLAAEGAPDRQKVVASYRAALELKGDAARGKAVFKKTCSTCHRLEDVGVEVGPDLLSALRNKTPETLLIDIFDPSREVDPRYLNYIVSTRAGRAFTGLVAAETASSITLRRAEKAEDTILRSQIEEIQATAKSLMPENLETQLNRQDAADLIAYLQAVAVPH
jgi:putative membrane-bound dehydrogenase-like protein